MRRRRRLPTLRTMTAPPPISNGPPAGYIMAQTCGHYQWFATTPEWGAHPWCHTCQSKVPTVCLAVDRQGRLVVTG